ncbi:hypothetical protein BKA66DRAFT_213953 [Pyrenochaeta sp. MPI-SDFR-AT-0127]|nr:hypothetical protein BKA66DRAFT_213953 [Pyrenochaeta sp. MPI-SDFR-AT-0127]
MKMASSGTVTVGGIPVDTSELNFNDNSSKVASIKTANITLIVLVVLFVGLRLFVRIRIVRKVFVDDILIVLAAVFTTALASVCVSATSHGLGTHVWMLPMTHIFDIIKSCIQYLYVCQVLYACAIAFTKIAIVASYLRFIQDWKFRIAMYLTAIVIVGLWFAGIFVTIFQCHPVSGAWDFTKSQAKCLDFVKYLYASSSINVATDVVLCALPCPYLWKLHMPVKQRITLCLLFTGGAGACIAAIIRIANLYTLRSLDVTYAIVPCLNLSVIECSLGIICISIPPLRPLAPRLFPIALRSIRSSAKSTLQSLSLGKKSAPSANDPSKMRERKRKSNLYPEENSIFERGSFEQTIDSASETDYQGDIQLNEWKSSKESQNSPDVSS